MPKPIEPIPFNKPYMTGLELSYITDAHRLGKLAGDGDFTKQCHRWLEHYAGSEKALLTHSCTAALEMSALLLDFCAGDEVIMPAYTFVSTANAFVLRGAVPVFVDVRADNLNINEQLIEQAITPRTKAIVPVHYAGVACEMDSIMAIAKRHNLFVIEDAAQAVMSSYKERALGGIGHLAAYSFHETKNVISGEGGALMINDNAMISMAEIIREKGTDRSQFSRGEVDKYTWQAVGSSYLPGELIAAFLWGQLQHAQEITRRRLRAWDLYHEMLSSAETDGLLRRPIVPETCQHNAHMYYVLLPPNVQRQLVIDELKRQGIYCVFHYVPLHRSPAGERISRCDTDLSVTEDVAARILRLPLWVDINEDQQQRVVEALISALT